MVRYILSSWTSVSVVCVELRVECKKVVCLSRTNKHALGCLHNRVARSPVGNPVQGVKLVGSKKQT